MFKNRLNLRKVAAIAACLTVTTMFSGCDDNEKESQSEIKVENSAALSQIVFADETAGKSDVTFVTSGAWTSTITSTEGMVTWISIDPTHGNAAGTYTVSVSLNPNATGNDRTATIKITCNSEEITISVTQKATKEDGSPYEPSGKETFDLTGVYVAGIQSFAATLWNNGTVQSLTDGKNRASANSVYVSGSDVYVAGSEQNAQGKSVAKLWINGKAQNLTDGTNNAYALSVYVSGDNFYVAGYEQNAQGKNVAMFWKNNEDAQALTDGINNAEARSVYVSGSDVYIAGIYNYGGILWINGERQNTYLVNESNSVYISGSDVYVTGGQVKPFLWKNGEVQFLGDKPGEGLSVYVSGNDVYVAGYERTGSFMNTSSNPIAKLWKNGVLQNLPPIDGFYESRAHSVYVSNGNVYVVGTLTTNVIGGVTIPKLWINGVEHNLSVGPRSVFVVEK